MTINEMKYILGVNDNSYFSADSMEISGSVIEVPPNDNGFLIESIVDFTGEKQYMVKGFTSEGDIRTIEPAEIAETYQHFPTLKEAKLFMDELTQTIGKQFGLPSSIKETAINSGMFVFRNDIGDEHGFNANLHYSRALQKADIKERN